MKQFTEEEKLKILTDVVAIKSVNENEIEVANYLKDLFAEYEIATNIVPVTDTRVNLVAEIGSGRASYWDFWSYGCCFSWR